MEHLCNFAIIKGLQEIAPPHMKPFQDATDVFPFCDPVQGDRLSLRHSLRVSCLHLVHPKPKLIGLIFLHAGTPPSNLGEHWRAKKLPINKNIAIVYPCVRFRRYIPIAVAPVQVPVVQPLQDAGARPPAVLQPQILAVRNEIRACRAFVFPWVSALQRSNGAIVGSQSGSFPLN